MQERKWMGVAALLAVAAVPAVAGSFTSDFSNPNQTGFTLNGGTRPDGFTPYPAIEDGHLALTYNENSQQATIVLDDLDGGAAIESFTVRFKVQVGPGSGNPADGFSFSFGPEVTSFSNFGEEGTGNGVIVAFDIYDNGGGEAPAIDVKYNGAVVASAKFVKADMVTSQFEDVEIVLNRNGTLSVKHKGQAVHTDVVLPAFAPQAGQFGIGARTGGENANQWIDDLSVTTTRANNAAPSITTQPQSQTVAEGSPVSFTVGYDGSAPLTLQWLSNNVQIAGATAATYTIPRASYAGNGAKYKCTVTNASGAATSQEATLTVTADTSAPVLQYATGTKSFKGVRVWFSEPVDAASAQTAANYQIAGLTITSATLVAPAGSAGDNMVDLVTSTQTAGQTYTLTVTGVKDQSAAKNPVAAGNSVQFTSWTLATGYLLFEHFDNLTGASDADIDTALQDPRVVDGTPTTTGFLSGRFDTRTFFADDSHENYLAKITGWITPTESGDYYFFLRADDAARLYLSSNDTIPDPATDFPICNEPDCCDGFYEPESGDPATTATPISLVAGRRYGVLALLKEAGGGDYLMVAWRKSTDTTAAAALPYLPGQYLSTYVDPNTDLAFTQQPTDQVGVLPSTGIEFYSRDFNANDGGFTVVNTEPAPPGPWVYDAASGKWVADGSESACTGPYNSKLSSPGIKLTQDGSVSLSFSHRYSFEGDLWDAGQVFVSVNGGAFSLVPAENFSANGYAEGLIIGTGIANGKRAFNGNSPGYANGEFITSKALLGTFSKDDTIAVQFAGIWDECSAGTLPNWVIDSVKLDLLPMIIQDFAKNNGNFTVENTTPPPPGPWLYEGANGQWVAKGSESACTGPYNSKLTSPAYVLPESDEVTLSFSHRYSFEGDLWDAGQVFISVNGGPFTLVPAENFTANGYAEGLIIGTGIANGKRAFNGDSPGYSAGTFITSSALLGTFTKNDTIAVQFAGIWDECSAGTDPNWVIKSLQLVIGKAAKASTFAAEVSASKQGTPVTPVYQWQRNDGAAWADIAGATRTSYTIYPVAADFNAQFRLIVSAPGKSITSNPVKLVQGAVEPPTITISRTATGASITFEGTLESANSVAGPYAPVTGATSPYVVPTPASGAVFFRSAK